MIEYKVAHGGLGLKDESPDGSFTAIIASLAPAVDHDGDVTLQGAIPDARVVVSRYNHSSARDVAIPVGYANITTDDRYAYAQGQFFLSTPEGRSTYDTLKALHDQGIEGDWSYAYRVVDAAQDRAALARYSGARRVLRSVLPKEVSPVFAGAGIGTRTLSLKCSGCDGGYKSGPASDAGADRFMAVDELATAPTYRATIEAAEVEVDPSYSKLARAFAAECAGYLRIATPIVRWFKGADLGVRGLAFLDRSEIWLSTDIGWYEQAKVTAHEVKHLAQTADAYEEKDAWEFSDRAMRLIYPDVRRFTT